jgi:glycosyltransferase involved in cell wall biosynthesis
VNYVHDYVTGSALTLLRGVSRLCAVERMTCSKAVAANLGLAHTTPVYPGIETGMFRVLPDRHAARTALGLPDDDLPVVALVGRIARWKGQDRFIRIAGSVLRDTDAHFVIVGSPLFGDDAAYVPELIGAVAAAGLQNRIHFVPWQDDMRNVYGAIDLACNTSTREPLGRTMIEALASGIPVVCFEDAGACEILVDYPCGTSVPVNDEVAFARAVFAYLTDGKLMATARSCARLAAAPYDMANVFTSFADVIERVGTSRARSLTSSKVLRAGQAKPNVR